MRWRRPSRLNSWTSLDRIVADAVGADEHNLLPEFWSSLATIEPVEFRHAIFTDLFAQAETPVRLLGGPLTGGPVELDTLQRHGLKLRQSTGAAHR